MRADISTTSWRKNIRSQSHRFRTQTSCIPVQLQTADRSSRSSVHVKVKVAHLHSTMTNISYLNHLKTFKRKEFLVLIISFLEAFFTECHFQMFCFYWGKDTRCIEFFGLRLVFAVCIQPYFGFGFGLEMYSLFFQEMFY